MKHGHIIFLEGLDGSGKTTLAKILARVFGYRVHVYDRGLGTCYVMDSWYGRPVERQRKYFDELAALNTVYHVHQIILRTNLEVCINRLGARGDIETSRNELKEQERLLNDWAGLSQHVVDTRYIPAEIMRGLPYDIATYVRDNLLPGLLDADTSPPDEGGVSG